MLNQGRLVGSVFMIGLLMAAAAGAYACAPAPSAASYPTKAVEIVVPFAAGGAGDILTRKVGAYLQKTWNQPVNVVNKAGAGGTPGTVAVLQAPPDGYTVGQGGTANLYLNEAVQKDLPYKWSDMTYISMLGATPVVFVVKGDSKWKTLKDLAEDIKADPTKLKFGTSGVAGPSTFITALLAQAVGVDPNKLNRVPFDGGAPTVAAVAGGHVEFAGQNLPEVLELVKGGQLRALAIGMPQRSTLLPDVPTTKDAGFESVRWAGLCGFFGPSNVPAEVVKKWEDALSAGIGGLGPELEKAGLAVQYLNSKDFRSATEQEFKTALALSEKLGLRK